MSPTVLYAAIFPPFRRPAPEFCAPRLDGLTEADVRRVVREEITRVEDRQAREKQR